MTWPHRGKVQLASDNTHLADLRTLPMPRAHHAALGEWCGTTRVEARPLYLLPTIRLEASGQFE
jgi:hypothetical protein